MASRGLFHLLGLLIAGNAVVTVAHVCYAGQDFGGNNTNPRWVIPQPQPCKCTQVLPGGVNVGLTQKGRLTPTSGFETANFATNDKGRIVTALPECGNSSSEPEMPTPKQNGRGSLEIFLPMYEELDQNQQSVSTPPSTPNPHGSSTLNPGRYLYCQDFNNDGNTGYVLTRIYPSDLQGTNTGVAALCDMESDGSGWIVFQRSGYQGLSALQWDFDKTFEEYKNGFGSLRGNNFWWGNDHLANITQDGQWELRVDIWWQQTSTLGQAEEFRRATYASFGVSGPGYTLSVSGYQSSSNLSDVLSNLNGMEFSARDGGPQATCAEISGGGWWFDQCVDWQANLNGHTACVGNDCNSDRASSSEMKVRRVNK